MSSTSKYWCWTWHNATPDNIKGLNALKNDVIDYIVFGHETGDSGKSPHLQGYTEFKNKISKTAVKKILGSDQIHLEIRLAKDRLDAINYCKKGTQPHEEWNKLKEKGPNFGKDALFVENILKKLNEGKGARTDWHEFHDAIKDKSLSELMEIHPEKTIKYWSAVKSIKAGLEQQEAKDRILNRFKDFKLRSWQRFLMKIIKQEPDARRVYWIYDTCGGTGKTEFSRYLSVVHKACFLQNAKTADVAHAWNGEQIVVFNFPKCTEGQINYNAIESIKDATVFSPKYDSGSKIFERPHVVCFANFAPDRTKLMDDRWYIIHLTEKDQKNDIVVSIEQALTTANVVASETPASFTPVSIEAMAVDSHERLNKPVELVPIRQRGEIILADREDNLVLSDLEDDLS